MARTVIARKCTLGLLGLVGLVACSSTPPPRDLVTARSAYQRAQSGPAAELAPAQLDTAMQALRRAEDSFREEGDTPETRDLSYIALRKAEMAEAAGGLEQANQQRSKADKDFKSLTETAQVQLDATRRELDETRKAAERASQYMKEEAERAKAELKKSKAQLEAERQARLAVEKKLASALRSLEEVAKVKQEKRGVIITLEGAVLFASGKSALLPIAQQKLDQVAKALQDQGYKRIVVEGHTDSRGSRNMNMDLSYRRAESVRSYLISRGIDANKISAVGLGPDRPVAENSSAEGRANNRRVELVVTPE
jgi:outer membrane protein OmpA-like peptidoglycan-associated protein